MNAGTSAYVYGLDLVSQQTGIYKEYPLHAALGSMLQMTDQSSAITGYKRYELYDSLLDASGETHIAYSATPANGQSRVTKHAAKGNEVCYPYNNDE